MQVKSEPSSSQNSSREVDNERRQKSEVLSFLVWREDTIKLEQEIK